MKNITMFSLFSWKVGYEIQNVLFGMPDEIMKI
jgi:hypothetical protein